MNKATVVSVALFSLLAGCGTYVPDLQGFSKGGSSEEIMVQDLISYVSCDVRRFVLQVIIDDLNLSEERKKRGLKNLYSLDWLKTWGSQITFTLMVDEKSQFNPGVSLNTIFPNAVTRFGTHPNVNTPQSFSLGLAGAYSTGAPRKETLSLYMNFNDFTGDKTIAYAKSHRDKDSQLPKCDSKLNGYSHPDIKFLNWLRDAALSSSVNGGVLDFEKSIIAESKVSKKDALSHQVTFIVIYGANATPV